MAKRSLLPGNITQMTSDQLYQALNDAENRSVCLRQEIVERETAKYPPGVFAAAQEATRAALNQPSASRQLFIREDVTDHPER